MFKLFQLQASIGGGIHFHIQCPHKIDHRSHSEISQGHCEKVISASLHCELNGSKMDRSVVNLN